MNTRQERLAAVFNEWARQYATDPKSFAEILDSEGKAVENYGERAAIMFDQVSMEVHGELL